MSFAWHSFGAGIVATGWQDLIVRQFPVERRGRFFGLTMFLGAGGGVLGAAVTVWLLNRFASPWSFFFCFAIATVLTMISWSFLALAREPVEPGKTERITLRDYLGSSPELLRRDQNYRRFLIVRLLMALGGMGIGFLTVAAVQRWDVPDAQAGVYTFVLLAGQTTANWHSACWPIARGTRSRSSWAWRPHSWAT